MLPGTIRALRVLLYVEMARAVISIVGLALGYYPGPIGVKALLLVPAVAVVSHVFYLQAGRRAVRITLTVALSVNAFISVCAMVTKGSAAGVIGLVLGASMLVLLHQRSSRTWFAHPAPEAVAPRQSAIS